MFNADANLFSGPCAGDDGGPLTVEEEGVKRLVGVVSGGIGCGIGVPSWYTKVSSDSHSLNRAETIRWRSTDRHCIVTP